MTASKAWDWKKGKDGIWFEPSEESYYLAERWKDRGYTAFLDFGCGLGRHSVYFARQGFKVSAFDLSTDGVNHLLDWAKKEGLTIDATKADMLCLPYTDNSFDCLLAYHVVSHTDSVGIRKILSEIRRVLKPKGEFYITLCSKETWSYKDAGYPAIDDNTVIKTEEGPEKGVPHFYASYDDIVRLFKEAKLEMKHTRHIEDIYFDVGIKFSKHYFVLAGKEQSLPELC